MIGRPPVTRAASKASAADSPAIAARSAGFNGPGGIFTDVGPPPGKVDQAGLDQVVAHAQMPVLRLQRQRVAIQVNQRP
jgi:hypothetical protein